MSKTVVTGTEARDRAAGGAYFLADAIKPTLGPWGLNALLEKGNKVTNDGVISANEVEHPDEVANQGLKFFREVCLKTVIEAGDGTTSSLVLGEAILKECIKRLDNSTTFKGAMNATDLMSKIDKEKKEIIEKLIAMSEPVNDVESLIKSAMVSVADEDLAKLIGEMQFEIGKDGVIMVEDTIEKISSIEKVNGVRIDNGLALPGMMNNLEKQCVDVKNAKIIMTNIVFQSLDPILSLGKTLANSGVTDLIIVGRAFGDKALIDITENIKRGFKIYPVNAPYEDQVEVMKDMAAVLGGRFINVEQTIPEDIMVSDVGFVEHFIGHRHDALFSGKDDDKSVARVEKRIAELNETLSGAVSEFEKRNLTARIAQMSKGFAILKIGGKTDAIRKYKKDKADDAVNAVRCAFQEGVVPGAGLAFKTISDNLSEDYILKKPICAIYEQIISTAPTGFEVPEWVKDPVKVQRIVLEKACEVASTLATITLVSVTEKEKPRYVTEIKKEE